MARYCSETHVHPFPWHSVAEAIFLRYPNPFSAHVLSEDTLFRKVDGHVLYSRRFLTKTNRLPKWGEKFLASFKKMVPLVEESVVDRRNKVITTYTRNVGLSRFMSAVEKVSYRQDPNDPNVTIAVKEAWIESGLYGLRYYAVTPMIIVSSRVLFSDPPSRTLAWSALSRTAAAPRPVLTTCSITCIRGSSTSTKLERESGGK
jgi:hypothetical protein